MDKMKIARNVVGAYICMTMEDEYVTELQANGIAIEILINRLAPHMDTNDSFALDLLDYFKSRLLTEIRALKENNPIPRFFVCNIYGRFDIWDERTDYGELDECEEDLHAPWDEDTDCGELNECEYAPWDNCDDELAAIWEEWDDFDE